jgi:hypothetical protein
MLPLQWCKGAMMQVMQMMQLWIGGFRVPAHVCSLVVSGL